MPAKAVAKRRREDKNPAPQKRARLSAAAKHATKPGSAHKPCIVGIGASAGGFEAIRAFLKSMPAESGIAFVIVQHLDPTHASLAAELFAKFTTMPVSEARNGTLLLANHVYTAPSNKELAITGGRLRLTPRNQTKKPHLPIDYFFNSLGKDCAARAIGIVLSGTGTDGALGLKTIAANGGVVLAQEPSTAQVEGMPRSAIATGVVNYVLPVEKMPKMLCAYASHPYVAIIANASVDEGDEQATRSLLDIINTRRGYDFQSYKRATLLRRIRRRMILRGVLGQSDYVALLKKDSAEIDALFHDLLIGVTDFFRDPEAWKALNAEVLGPLVAAKRPDDPIRIWVPGCSTGEEAYSMAILVLERLRRARKACPVHIFATDTNNEGLEIGRQGRYPAGIASRMPVALLRRYFIEDTDRQHFTVSQQLRTAVIFGVQNLFSDPPFGRADLISCRNVLIYLEPEVQKRVLNIFHFALLKDAHLFLGTAESNGGRDDLLKPISKKWHLYQRVGVTRVDALRLPANAGGTLSRAALTASPIPPPVTRAASIAQKLILDRFTPASILVNEHHQVLYFCGPTDDFLLHPRGAPTNDLLALVREGLRPRLRSALQEAAGGGLTISVTEGRMKRGDDLMPVRITVTPIADGEFGPVFLVVFRHDTQPTLRQPGSKTERTLVRHLEEELRTTREDLRSSIENSETANADLKIANEEVVSVNEEFRSLNEELESSKEELQSLNEELATVNQQLVIKVGELESSNSDLSNLLHSSDIATICLDPSFRIKWFTPATSAQFKFLAGDIGRSISDFSIARVGGNLLEAAKAVLQKRTISQSEFQTTNGRRYIRRLLPYKNDNNQVCGVIVSYTDISDLRLATAAADAARHDLTDSRDQNDKLHALSAALAMAEENERRALAQDLHDDLGQLMAVISLKAKGISKLDMPDTVHQAMQSCLTAIDQANRKLRAMAFKLNPPLLYKLGLVAALDWIADEMRHVYKLEVHTKDDGTPKPLEHAVITTLFRAVRELLINVAKHADVTSATVTTARGANDTLFVTVSDAGIGFEPGAAKPVSGVSGYGLLSVRERIGFLGGEVALRSNPGEGTSVTLTVPMLPPPAVAPSAKMKKGDMR